MAEEKSSFILYADYIQIFDGLEDDEAGRLVKHLFRYVNDQNPTPPDRLTGIIFAPIKSQLKRDLEAWKKVKVGKSDGGKLGNLKRYHKDLYDKVVAKQMSLEDAVSVADNRKGSHTDK